jgi:vesicle coat complex subunit
MIVEESYPDNLMINAIKYVNPCEDNNIKKKLLLFWEVIEKRDKAKPTELNIVFLLVCNGLRKDLTHPNEVR